MMVLIQYRLSSGAYEVISIIEYAHSIVWTERYQDYGEAQVILPLGYDVRLGDVLAIPNRNMSVEVIRITETESQITVICKDSLSVLDRRILVSGISNDGLISTFITKMLNTVIEDTGVRNLPVVRVGDLSEISATAKIQRSYSHIGKTLLELAKTYGFDINARLSDGLLYIDAGTSTSERIWGIGRYLSGYRIDKDTEPYKNTVYVGGQIVNGYRKVIGYPYDNTSFVTSGMDRFETFVDRRDLPYENISKDGMESIYGTMTAQAIITLYTVTEGTTSPYVVKDFIAYGTVYVASIGVAISYVNESLKATVDIDTLIANADTSVERRPYAASVSGDYYAVNMGSTTVNIPIEDVLDGSLFSLDESLYESILYREGREEVAQCQPVDLIEVVTEGTTPYVDYELGDTITVISEKGERYSGVLREIVESWDSNGYNVTPTIDFSNASE